ncbi:MAG: substrate-binding domain-containing protein, partial [Anaerobutyricum soehngenii]
DNVSKVLMAVAEGSCEVGTTYYSDIYGYEDDIKILEKVSSDLTGDVIYPIAQIVNKEADKKQTEAAEDFMDFLLSDEAAKVFESYYFDTDIK